MACAEQRPACRWPPLAAYLVCTSRCWRVPDLYRDRPVFGLFAIPKLLIYICFTPVIQIVILVVVGSHPIHYPEDLQRNQ